MDECIAAVEAAFLAYGEGRGGTPGILGMHAAHGGFHFKAGFLNACCSYFAAKLTANFPENQARFQMPTIQSVVVLCDADNGFPPAIMDLMEITSRRTRRRPLWHRHICRGRTRTSRPCVAPAFRDASKSTRWRA